MEKFKAKPKKCKNCGYTVFLLSKCPRCGHFVKVDKPKPLAKTRKRKPAKKSNK